ncbi:hypothetical protein [Polynucleobacter sp. Nonnen-W13]|uniref:hypothetical protein n=1 Tax=Polynucleobacter sp. Nonnen-W13 TaxID=1855625 RepID=UPI001C0B0718|nr:hypothetical protein [Polynucleobacter sp. Nonnen-W13]
MKYLLLLSCFFLFGCGLAPKSVVTADGKTALQIRCVGSANSWNTCYAKAKESCPAGFEIVDKEQFMADVDLPVRVLTYRCK